MSPDKYKKVKEIFLAICEKPADARTKYLDAETNGDAEIRREVEALIKEHNRETQIMPDEPEGPLGSMSAILSRAGVELPPPNPAADLDASNPLPNDSPKQPARPARYLDDSSVSGQESHSGIVDAGRFMAGSVVAGRYRIIELLGRGGMGEVYRADDITLNQSIALKFLPALFGQDAKWLERFHNEVRLARQVTHPNVCRVFDIGEFQGEQFISMEYIDGENLASLLRRIGRVPHDKAIQIARQLCAGLAAAHDRGVLHRDLKPANVMIDGRGSVRITDFGLAAPIDALKSDAVRAGTPAYMSPEQLAGRPVTVRSDVYSTGLVLYEMFTGKRAFRAESLREYQKLHSSEDPTPPSEILDDIDPIVDRVIMRCLEKDPKDRPISAMSISAALPGGNPLREILAAGETPSPEVVAAAGEAHRVMRPKIAIALLVTALIALFYILILAPRNFVVQRAIQNEKSAPIALTGKAHDILHDLGYTDPPRDSAQGFDVNRGYYLHVDKDQTESNRLWQLWRSRLGLVYFWYRQSPELFVPSRPEGVVLERDPAPGLPGMIKLRLDPLGHLINLEVDPSTPVEAIPEPDPAATQDAATNPSTQSASNIPSTSPASAPAPLSDWLLRPRTSKVIWSCLFEAAGIDLSTGNFHAVIPQGTPPVFADDRAAWEGNFIYTNPTTEITHTEPVRIEAAAYRGKPVYFAIIGTWKEEQLSQERAQILSTGQWNLYVQTALIVSLLLAGSILAWRNYRSGRGDRPGATRMALAFFLLGVIAWLFRAHHVADPVFEFILFQRGMGPVLYLVALIWIFYMALEPYVRRVWPETVISWSRLLAGKWFDPLVGRDVLFGSAVGILTTVLSLFEFQLSQWVGSASLPVPLPSITSISLMLNSTENYSGPFNSAIVSLYLGLILLLFLVLVRMVTHRRWIAVTSFILLFAVASAHYRVEQAWWRLGPDNWLSLFIQALLASALLTLLTRHGLVAVIFCLLTRAMLMDFPVNWDLSLWYHSASLIGISVTLIILLCGFYAALGGRPPLTLRTASS